MKNVLDSSQSAAPVPLSFRLTPLHGAWQLTEESCGAIGGIFASIAAALAFVRTEARSAPGSRLVVELSEPTRAPTAA